MNFDTCIILAAGRGTRMGVDSPKVLLKIDDKPAIQHVIDFWKDSVPYFIVVVGHKGKEVDDYMRYSKVKYETVIQYDQRGIAHAILQAKAMVKGNFVVALGDCLNLGYFVYPERMTLGYGLWTGNYQKQLELCCSAWTENGSIVRLVEKGRAPFVGIGTYFFDRRVFDYIEREKPSSYRNEVEITDVMQHMIDSGERISPVYLHGEFVNLTCKDDIEYANELVKSFTK